MDEHAGDCIPGFDMLEHADEWVKFQKAIQSANQPVSSAATDPPRVLQPFTSHWDCPQTGRSIQYIDLARHIFIQTGRLASWDPQRDAHHTIIVRDEFSDLFDDVRNSKGGSLYLHGQTGIGKTWCIHVLLMMCISCSIPVFYQYELNGLLYFGPGGVQEACTNDLNSLDMIFYGRLRSSWLLIDIEEPTWTPQPSSWAARAKHIVFAASNSARRTRYFGKHFRARTWIMTPWDDEEMAALSSLSRRNDMILSHHHRLIGHMPFSRQEPSAVNFEYILLREAIDSVFRHGICHSACIACQGDTEELADETQKIFLLLPSLMNDAQNNLLLNRQSGTVTFTSNFTASGFLYEWMRLLLDQRKRLRDDLLRYGMEVGNCLLRAIIVNLLLQDSAQSRSFRKILGLTERPVSTEMFGDYQHFTFVPKEKPLHLYPTSPNFRIIDSILITFNITYAFASPVRLHQPVQLDLDLFLSILNRLSSITNLRDHKIVYMIVGQKRGDVAKAVAAACSIISNAKTAEKVLEGGTKTTILQRLEVEGLTLDIVDFAAARMPEYWESDSEGEL